MLALFKIDLILYIWKARENKMTNLDKKIAVFFPEDLKVETPEEFNKRIERMLALRMVKKP